ncbi:60S ribosomal protein L31 [Podila clonocystis]|nr:60S ribosomal protein L31 [Podila clonocystis]
MAPLTQAEKRLQSRARKKKRSKRAQKSNLYGFQNQKKRAPHAIHAIKMFTYFKMGTRIVKLDPEVNKKVWKKGRKSIQERSRREKAPTREKSTTYVSHVPVESFSGLQDVVIEDAEDPVEAENAVSEDVSEMMEIGTEMDARMTLRWRLSKTPKRKTKRNSFTGAKNDPNLDVMKSSKAQEDTRIAQEGTPTGPNNASVDNSKDGAKVDSGDKPMADSGN